jgi:hypothetical protein
MNTCATPPETMRRSSSNSVTSRTTERAEMRARPRRIADLLVFPGGPSAADSATDTRGAHSSSHWVMIPREPDAEKRAPAQVKTLARELGVDTRVAWDALDCMYA